MKPRALYYNILKFQTANLELLHRHFDVVQVEDPRADTDSILRETEALFAPLGFRTDKDKMDRCPKLRAVISNTTSIPHIDFAHAATRSIHVCALHDEQAFLETITPTAEHAIGLMMAVWRKIPAAHSFAAEGGWDRRPWGAPRMLSRMRLGIMGLGRLGRKVAAIAKAIGMDVAFHDPGKEGSMESLEALARRSDILSLHAPGNEQTRGLVSRRVLEALPPGAVLINTARGELLDTDALLDLLRSGRLAGAALDCIDGEYEPEFSAAWKSHPVAVYAARHNNLILTPHIGGSTHDAWLETERHVIQKACEKLELAGGNQSLA